MDQAGCIHIFRRKNIHIYVTRIKEEKKAINLNERKLRVLLEQSEGRQGKWEML